MNYIKELRAFKDWLLLNDLPTSAIALWHTLMSINNMTGWKERFNAPNQVVGKLTGLSKQGVVDARKKLLENGLIEYEKGRRGKAPIYKMVSLVNSLDQSPYQLDDQSDYQSHDQDLNIPKQKQNKTKGSSGEVEVGNPFEFYQENFGMASPFILESIGMWVDDMNEEIVIAAMKLSLKNGANSFSYIETILKEWAKHNLSDIDSIRAFEKSKRNNRAIPFQKKQTQNNTLKLLDQLEDELEEEKVNESQGGA